jgi:hypothetical protein
MSGAGEDTHPYRDFTPVLPMARKKSKSPKPTEATVAGVVGVGLDAEDGHERITRTEEMILVGGSAETHEKMQETAIRFGENLEKKGKTIREASVNEVLDLLRDAIERTGR